MTNSNFKIIPNKYSVGRCVHCDAFNYCTTSGFKCECTLSQHYMSIKTERKIKLKKIYESR